MIYAIAAYSITLGVLALYLVHLQHRRRLSTSELALQRGREGSDPSAGFNVGAFLLAPIWMLRHGMKWPGALLLVVWVTLAPLYQMKMWIPLLFVAMIPIAAGAALGFIGNRVAAQYKGITGPGALSADQLPWALIGIVLYLFVLPWTWYFTTSAS